MGATAASVVSVAAMRGCGMCVRHCRVPRVRRMRASWVVRVGRAVVRVMFERSAATVRAGIAVMMMVAASRSGVGVLRMGQSVRVVRSMETFAYVHASGRASGVGWDHWMLRAVSARAVPVVRMVASARVSGKVGMGAL